MPLLTLGAALNGLGSGFALGSMTTSTFDIAPEGGIARFQSLRRFAADGPASLEFGEEDVIEESNAGQRPAAEVD